MADTPHSSVPIGNPLEESAREVARLHLLLDSEVGDDTPMEREIAFRKGLQKIASLCSTDAGIAKAIRSARDHGIRAFSRWPLGEQGDKLRAALNRLTLRLDDARGSNGGDL